MRLQHWFAAVLGLWVALGGAQQTWAQTSPGYPMNAAEPWVKGSEMLAAGRVVPAAAQITHPPIPVSATGAGYIDSQYGGYIPSHSAISTGVPGQTMLPPGVPPWPGVSPYDHQYSQHIHENGLWAHDFNSRGQQYSFGIEAMINAFRLPKNKLIGHENGSRIGTVTGQGRAVMARDYDVWDAFATQPGLKLRWEYLDPDDSGLQVIGWWASEANEPRFYGNVDSTEANPLTLVSTNPTLPLWDGTPVGSNPLSTASYDKRVIIAYQVEAFGASITHLMTPTYRKTGIRVHPLYGIRYLGIRENFRFTGTGSGLNAALTPMAPPFIGQLQSMVKSHLAGPEVGFRIDIGGSHLKLRSESKLGLLGNREEITVKGFGLGNGLDPGYVANRDFFERKTTTHVSPSFEQSLVVEANLIQYMPLVRNVHYLRDAKFRAGYSILVAWEVARPNDSINYLAPPANPQVRNNRTDWYVGTWTFGASWDY
jgi:hypothetical protein